MAVYKIFPEKDSTIYSLFPFMNTGVDEIVEATTTTFPNRDVFPQVSRTLIQFDSNDINNTIDDVIGGLQYLSESRLRLYAATIEGLNADTALEVYPISGAWNMGTGKYLDDPLTTNGCSWQWIDYSGSTRWQIIGFNPSVTASMDPLGAGGGATWWFKDPQLNFNTNGDDNFTQSLSYRSPKDINVGVNSIIKTWYSSSKDIKRNPSEDQILNNGFIIKQTDANEFVYQADKSTELKYFSSDTNTIYPPQLEFKWVDATFDTGSNTTNTVITTRNLVASLQDNPGEFRESDIYDFRIKCRPKFPARVYQTASLYTNFNYLPSESYYAIKDLDTNEFVIDFDTNFTQISADEESNYFRIYMNGLQPERYYKILIKTIIGRDTLVLDDNYYFKIING
jgi:hypothetical protein